MKYQQFLAGITAVAVVFLGASLLGHSRFLSHVLGVVNNQSRIKAPVPNNIVMTSTNVSPARPMKLAPYSIEDLVEMSSVFFKTFGILVYDPIGDDFLLLDNNPMQRQKSSFAKLVSGFERFTSMLRTDFPERFRGPESPELGKLSDFDISIKLSF
jgi:hypothetical protein